MTASLVSVPLTLRYLGPERFGLWVVLNSFFGWLSLADFGVGNSLINNLSEAFGRDDRDRGRAVVATAAGLLTAQTSSFALLGAVALKYVDWRMLLGESYGAATPGELSSTVGLCFILFILSVPLSVVPRIYQGYQQSETANYFAIVGSLLGLGGLVWATSEECGLFWLVLATQGSTVAVTFLNGVYLFVVDRPWLRPRWADVSKATASKLLSTGWLFFALSVESVIISQIQSYLVLRYVSAEAVTPYAILLRIFNLIMMPMGIIGSALWAAFAEARTKDPTWVKATFRRTLKWASLYGVASALTLFLASRTLIGVWAGPSAIPDISLVVTMSLIALSTPIGTLLSMMLNSLSQLRVQVVAGAVNAALSLTLSIALSTKYGATGVAAGSLLAAWATWMLLVPALRREGVVVTGAQT